MITQLSDYKGIYSLDQNTPSSDIDQAESLILLSAFGNQFTTNLLSNYNNASEYKYYVIANGSEAVPDAKKWLVPSVFCKLNNVGNLTPSVAGSQTQSKVSIPVISVFLNAQLTANLFFEQVYKFIYDRGYVNSLIFYGNKLNNNEIEFTSVNTGFPSDFNFLQIGESLQIAGSDYQIVSVVHNPSSAIVQVNNNLPNSLVQIIAYMYPYNQDIFGQKKLNSQLWDF